MNLLALIYVLTASEALYHESEYTDGIDLATFSRNPPGEVRKGSKWCRANQGLYLKGVQIADCGYESKTYCSLSQWARFEYFCQRQENVRY